jgi:hypothetical protein
MLATSSCSDDRGGHELAVRPGLAGREGVLIKEGQMSKTTGLFAVSAAALILACVAGWAISDTQARAAAPATVQIDPLTMMTSAKQMPTEHFADYSFVCEH